MSKFLNEVKQRLKNSGNLPRKIVKKKARKKVKSNMIESNSMFDDNDYPGTFTISGNTSISGAGISNTLITTTSGTSGEISFTDFNVIDPGKERQDEIMEHIKVLEEKLLILQNNVEKHKKYPILKDLYDQYKMIEALIGKEIKKEKDED